MYSHAPFMGMNMMPPMMYGYQFNPYMFGMGHLTSYYESDRYLSHFRSSSPDLSK
jgi:hypothetical protein